MVRVEDIMSRELYTLFKHESVYQARKLMHDKKIRHILVVDSDDMFVGLLTQRDVLSAAISVFADISDDERKELEQGIPIKEIMTDNVIVAEEGTSLSEAAQHLINTKHGCLPVVADGLLKGIVTEADFVKLALRLMENTG